MDDLSRAWFGKCFDNDFLRKHGAEFQEFFADVMEKAYPTDFQRVRPYGSSGDLKCDGYLLSTGTVFQVYAPYGMDLTALLRKIREDFSGAVAHWEGRMRRWVFVHNDRRGLPAQAVQLLENLRRQGDRRLQVDIWAHEELRGVAMGLPEEKLVALFGPPLTREHMERVGFDTLKPLLLSIQRRPPPDELTIGPVSADKLAANSLSPDAGRLLAIGRLREKLVEGFLSQWPDPTFGEDVAEAFRRQYQALKAVMPEPDDIFSELQSFAGGGRRGDPGQEAAVLAVLSYFFERCDIFEEPESEKSR